MLTSFLTKVRRRLARLRPIDHEAIFSDIYRKNEWGPGSPVSGPFNSGSGSNAEYASPYLKLITDYIVTHQIKKVVDLGCGDFRVGKAIVDATGVSYVGVDVVPELVAFNQATFGTQKVSFQKLNITRDPLPDGDLCLIRQVLQHLSNNDIQAVLKKTGKYRHLIATEHLPLAMSAAPNRDKAPNGDIRYSQGSGVYLDLPPFNRKLTQLLEVLPIEHPESKIVSFLVAG